MDYKPSAQAVEQYGGNTTDELRKLARERGQTGVALLSQRKETLIGLAAGEITLAQLQAGGEAVPAAQAEPKPTTAGNGDLADAIAKAIQGRLKLSAPLDEARVRQIVQEEAPKPTITQIVVNRQEPKTIKGHTHQALQLVLRKIACGAKTIYLVGPAGTGKTVLAAQVAESLGLPFTQNSLSAGSTEADLFGCVLPNSDGTWGYRESSFVHTYRHGGIHLFDEIDGADPNLLVAVNAPLSNGHLHIARENLSFERHKDTIILCAANTYGTGSDAVYVGRNPLDGASRDRFQMGMVYVSYDETLEREIVSAYLKKEEAEALLQWAWEIRKRIDASKLRRTMSTRILDDCAKYLAGGFTLAEITETYFAGWSADERRRAEGKV